jgi:hypothetical protein
MKTTTALFALILFCSIATHAQTADNQTGHGEDSKISLPYHPGQLRWSAEGFKIIETSAKPKGVEIGLRGQNKATGAGFLGFLFLVPGQAPLSSAKCRDGALAEQKQNPTLKILPDSPATASGKIPVALATYSEPGHGKTRYYKVRGFVATSDICGDLEFYSETPISPDEPALKTIFESYRLDPDYIAGFNDILLYAQILYEHEMYKAAAPIFEQALTKLGDDQSQLTMRRVTTDQAGMSYGMSGDISKARAIFEAAVAKDPNYPLYYYNLACADAEENKLADARTHLQQAFARKKDTIPGETLPDPTKDDSFLPHKSDKEFWKFLQSLQ